MKRLFFIGLFIWSSVSCLAQTALTDALQVPDSVTTFTLNNLYASMWQYHPLIKQAELLSEVARQDIRFARGAFDPKIEVQGNLKEYDQKEYYNKWYGSFTVPTWFPVDPKVGIERNTGTYLSIENQLPDEDYNRQLFAGLSLPIGRGLFTDERRATLKQAQLGITLAEAEQVKLINKILLEAAKDYWQWYYAYFNYQLNTRNAQIAEEIFRRVRLNEQLGEASGLDTLQADITRQQRQVERQEAYLDLINSSVKLSNHLWDSVGNPLQISARLAPQPIGEPEILSNAALDQLLKLATTNHPELQKLSVKLDQLEIDRKLATEYLKPRLNLNYNFLNQPLRPTGEFQTFTFLNNYKFGLDFYMPILLRKERAKVAQTRLKIQNTTYERTQTEREILNQVQATFNQLVNTNTLLQQQNLMAANYQRLLQGELLNLENGESDLFKINVQQEKLIQSQSKLLKLRAEFEKQKASLYWAAGLRNLSLGED
ncbi:MAG: TolC family protein [Cyclobacteriaceae bacterium]|nr:MAG: TolC family protein [Cyclobacteriaceae bacterium]